MIPLFKVVTPGFHSTIQDDGRRGFQHAGVPLSGALDRDGYRLANALAGNSAGAACLEIMGSGPVFEVVASSVRVALIGGALLGSLVGTVIVAQTLYSSTKDHLGEFATLRALGSSSGYIHKVILAQAGISAVVGYLLGISIALTILVLSHNTALPMVMTPGLAFWLFTLTVGMCAISALSAIVKVTKIDPATVFSK